MRNRNVLCLLTSICAVLMLASCSGDPLFGESPDEKRSRIENEVKEAFKNRGELLGASATLTSLKPISSQLEISNGIGRAELQYRIQFTNNSEYQIENAEFKINNATKIPSNTLQLKDCKGLTLPLVPGVTSSCSTSLVLTTDLSQSVFSDGTGGLLDTLDSFINRAAFDYVIDLIQDGASPVDITSITLEGGARF